MVVGVAQYQSRVTQHHRMAAEEADRRVIAGVPVQRMVAGVARPWVSATTLAAAAVVDVASSDTWLSVPVP